MLEGDELNENNCCFSNFLAVALEIIQKEKKKRRNNPERTVRQAYHFFLSIRLIVCIIVTYLLIKIWGPFCSSFSPITSKRSYLCYFLRILENLNDQESRWVLLAIKPIDKI